MLLLNCRRIVGSASSVVDHRNLPISSDGPVGAPIVDVFIAPWATGDTMLTHATGTAER